jgi:predicted nucleic acid-binding protein
MTAFLDTDVLIDCLRGMPAARAWLEQSEAEAFQVPGVVVMELLMGRQNKAELVRTTRFLHAFDIAWPEASEFAQAFELLVACCLNSSLGIRIA